MFRDIKKVCGWQGGQQSWCDWLCLQVKARYGAPKNETPSHVWKPLNVCKQDREGLVFVSAFVYAHLASCLLQESARPSRIAGPSTVHGLQLQHVGCRSFALERRGIEDV